MIIMTIKRLLQVRRLSKKGLKEEGKVLRRKTDQKDTHTKVGCVLADCAIDNRK